MNFITARKELPRVVIEGETAEAIAHATSRSEGSINVLAPRPNAGIVAAHVRNTKSSEQVQVGLPARLLVSPPSEMVDEVPLRDGFALVFPR
ncbi:MAG: hypothetical protein M3468_16825, partial [Acidobacteriota bacterium]|nr:hypothetical protein [Acidobacteriota bacterium]